MSINYYADTDSLYINLSKKPSVDSEILSDDVVVDYGEHGEPVGIDIQHASEKVDLAEIAANYVSAKKSWWVEAGKKLILQKRRNF